ncbi:hypothetical protein OG252_51260 [Streptomyces sp. NBC_01352]|uniref:hypothetical protein n=1 Tax=unclassified Streptomyces TaxID=2593676 RepID=UPI00225B866C|nr:MULTISPECIES: hypothetical protein [unclassified Streptomyces]MCX4704316.1 hypothetical protein [Streptomyces sp. NBC_01373]
MPTTIGSIPRTAVAHRTTSESPAACPIEIQKVQHPARHSLRARQQAGVGGGDPCR